jgi:hypothetical protein
MIAEEFWIDSVPAYCSVCGFGRAEGPKLNGSIGSQLVTCSSCLSRYFDYKKSTPSDSSDSHNWKIINDEAFKKLRQNHKVVFV